MIAYLYLFYIHVGRSRTKDSFAHHTFPRWNIVSPASVPLNCPRIDAKVVGVGRNLRGKSNQYFYLLKYRGKAMQWWV